MVGHIICPQDIQKSDIYCSCCFGACGKPSQPVWSCMQHCRCSESLTSLINSTNWVALQGGFQSQNSINSNLFKFQNSRTAGARLPDTCLWSPWWVSCNFTVVLCHYHLHVHLPLLIASPLDPSFRSCIFTSLSPSSISSISRSGVPERPQKNGRKPKEILVARDVLVYMEEPPCDGWHDETNPESSRSAEGGNSNPARWKESELDDASLNNFSNLPVSSTSSL